MVNPKTTVELFSTCPALGGAPSGTYLPRVIDVARWSDEAGCRGILVYSDNSQLDPWLVAQVIMAHTTALCPLVAVQPIYAHPYAVAKMVASLAHLHGRRVFLNMVAGGFTNDLVALNDTTPHDERYARLLEYTTIIKRLVAGEVTTFAGAYYHVDKLKLTPPVPPELLPGIFISGSSEAGLAAARELGATAVKYPKPADEETVPPLEIPFGIRVGIIAREDEDEAWAIAHARFPEDRRGQLTRQVATKVSDSVWHRQLSSMAAQGEGSPYWLVPFENYKTMCPYLVGSHDRVAREIGRYVALGYRTFILDVPAAPDDLTHVQRVVAQATMAVTR
jgi:alkanesulfonate monooxygenase